MRKNRTLVWVTFGLMVAVAARVHGQASEDSGHSHAAHAAGAKVLLLPRELELRLAANALPQALRDEATLMVLEPTGYSLARKGSNPFTCIVSRRGGNFYPVCFDEEGTRTILPAFADDAVLRLQGKSDVEVEQTIAEGFASGKYRPPSRQGIAYMLSPATYMAGADGKLARSFPHTMFYAPYLTDAQIGGLMGRTAFVDRPGPHGMIIVLAGAKERETLLADSKDLVDEVERTIGLETKKTAAAK